MDIFSVFTMMGGLAMFLYGMEAMGDGLSKLSGGKLETILEKLTSNRLMAVLLGAVLLLVLHPYLYVFPASNPLRLSVNFAVTVCFCAHFLFAFTTTPFVASDQNKTRLRLGGYSA